MNYQFEQSYPREDCYICGFSGQHLLEKHHIVPRRLGGTNDDVNLVHLCPTCHRALERLYSRRFYTALGVVDEEEPTDRFNRYEIETDEDPAHDEEEDEEEIDKIRIRGEDPQERLWEHIREEQHNYPELPGVPTEEVYAELGERGFEDSEIEELIQSLRDTGEIYSPDQTHVRVV